MSSGCGCKEVYIYIIKSQGEGLSSLLPAYFALV